MSLLPLVSVNLTTYNRSTLLARCLDSILSQSYENLEIIVVDDASNDNTMEIASSYERKFANFKYIQHSTNKGNAYARNTAWENSSGKYIAFMDDDDEWIDKNKIKKQVEVFEKNEDKYDLILTNICSMGIDGKMHNVYLKIDNTFKFFISTSNGIVFSPTVLVKKNLLDKTNGFDTEVFRGVDADFYRESLLFYDAKFYLMEDITTLVHRDHLTRMGGRSKTLQKRFLWDQTIDYVLNKYSICFGKSNHIKHYWFMEELKNKFCIFLYKKDMSSFMSVYQCQIRLYSVSQSKLYDIFDFYLWVIKYLVKSFKR